MDERQDPVSLHDAEVAAGIARAAASGRQADRRPTPEQLCAAFGEPAASDDARRRAAAALALAGVDVRPDLLTAPAGERVELSVRGGGVAGGGGGSRPARAQRAVAGLAAVAVVLVAGVVAASLLGEGDGESVDEALPAGTSAATVAPTAGTTTAPATTPAPTTATTPGTTATAPEPDQDTAAERRAARRAKARRERRQAAARRRRQKVTVRVDAGARPTFLCVEDEAGRQLFGGTLSGRRVFRARAVSLNVGLATTVIKYGSRTIALPGSPAGVVVTRSGHSFLPLGQRPCA